MFVDLEESVYDQLYSDLRHSSTPTFSNTSTLPPRYISLALIFGTTFTTPKEQYMLRIGPIEPRLPSPSSSTPSSAYTHNLNPHLPASLSTTTRISPEEQASRTREEKKWDRLLIQNLMGILPFSPPSDQYPSNDHNQQQQEEGYGSLLGTDPLRHRTKTHLLMRAPAGKIFTGMLPQQHLLLHQDYPTPSPSPFQMDKEEQEEEVSATQSCWNQGCRNHRKPARWPIHHIHIFGPSPAISSDQEQGQDLQHTDSQDMNGDEDEMWYLIGSGIPLLSPLL